ncbi:hypothetical protein GH714_016091 [Hevea brasiliensis]|uniref:MLO-like protein n=1 Tax=Hevea brasiliensis TaxID=3981 RepID=A0A6A6M1M5_HEVBR|nr:hypothetical protein GH714_016091 [Hevea brasiliensis]
MTLFGFLSLLMGHWVVVVAKICIKTSAVRSRFSPCAINDNLKLEEGGFDSASSYANDSSDREEMYTLVHEHDHCPESFASQESLEKLHRLMFVLGVIHVLYNFIAIALAMIKVVAYSHQYNFCSFQAALFNIRLTRLTTFISHRTSHPWSQYRVLLWLLCFSRQFWSSINNSDYMALRYGFITTHELPLTYDFHNYMLRNMEEEFRDIVGIRKPH